MKEHGWIEPIVERVVGQVLDSHAAQLRTEIVRRVMEEIAADQLGESAPPIVPHPVRPIWRAPLPKFSWFLAAGNSSRTARFERPLCLPRCAFCRQRQPCHRMAGARFRQ